MKTHSTVRVEDTWDRQESGKEPQQETPQVECLPKNEDVAEGSKPSQDGLPRIPGTPSSDVVGEGTVPGERSVV